MVTFHLAFIHYLTFTQFGSTSHCVEFLRAWCLRCLTDLGQKKFVRMAYVHPLNVLLCVSCLLNMLAVDERERYLEKSNLDGNWEDSIPFFSSLHLAFFLIICAQILHIYHITDGMRGRRDSKILFQVTGFALAAVFPIVILLESYSLGFVLLYPIFCAWWMETITFRAATRGFLYWPYFLSTGTVVVLVLVMYFNEAPYRWNDWTFRVTYDVIMTVFVILLYPLLWTSFRMGSYTDVAILPPAAPALPLIAEKPTGHGDTPVVEVNIRPNSLAWDLLQMKSTTTLAAGDLRMQSSDGACFIIPYYLGQCRSSEIRLSVLFNDTYSPGALPTVFVPGGSEAVGCVAYFLVHDRLPLTPPLPGRVVDESESREFTKSNEWLRGIHPMTRSDGSSTTLSRGMSSRRPSFRSVHDGDTSGRRGLGRRRSSGRLSGALWLGRVAREHVAPTSLVSSTDDVSPRTESTLALETLVQVYLAAAKLVLPKLRRVTLKRILATIAKEGPSAGADVIRMSQHHQEPKWSDAPSTGSSDSKSSSFGKGGIAGALRRHNIAKQTARGVSEAAKDLIGAVNNWARANDLVIPTTSSRN
eukprot:Rmarinus@m.7898